VLSDLWVGFENLGHRSWLACRDASRLGRHSWYWRLGYALWLESLRGPAHRTVRKYALPEGLRSEDLIYGETPIGTAFDLLAWAGMKPGQRFCEVGCGRGVTSLVATLVFGAQSIGHEAVPALADKARWLTRALQCPGTIVTGHCGPYASAELYYLTATTWSADNLQRIQQDLAQAPAGARALVLSQPLPQWQTLEERKFPYSWGWCRTFLMVRP